MCKRLLFLFEREKGRQDEPRQVSSLTSYPPSDKKALASSEALGLFLIPGALSGSLCGALSGPLFIPPALGLSAEGLISY